MFSTDETKGFLSHALERSQLRLGTEPGAVATGSNTQLASRISSTHCIGWLAPRRYPLPVLYRWSGRWSQPNKSGQMNRSNRIKRRTNQPDIGKCCPANDKCQTTNGICCLTNGICQSTRGPCRVDTRPCSVDKRPCSVDMRSCSVDIRPCSVDMPPCSVDMRPCSVDMRPCSVDMRPCSVDNSRLRGDILRMSDRRPAPNVRDS